MAKDFLLDTATGDLAFSSAGDLVIGFSDEQHLQHLLLAEQGNYRHAPLTGVGLVAWVDEDSEAGSLRAAIEQQVVQDGAHIRSLAVRTGGDFTLDAAYND